MLCLLYFTGFFYFFKKDTCFFSGLSTFLGNRQRGDAAGMIFRG